MEINLLDKNLSEFEKSTINDLLKRENNNITDNIEQIWYLMDLIWDDFGCSNKNLNWEKIGKFYSHPIWLLNGLFIEQDEVSMSHRNAISDWVVKNKLKNVVDYGGGFGTLARLVAQKDETVNMNVYEPYPTEFGLKRVMKHNNITIIDKLKSNYDCLISTDVLEHVLDPLYDFATMIKSVKIDGYILIVCPFYPLIKCHLPQNFHLRYSFNQFAIIMGLEVVGILEGSHATIFKKVEEKKYNWTKIRVYEKISKLFFPLIEIAILSLKAIKKLLIK